MRVSRPIRDGLPEAPEWPAPGESDPDRHQPTAARPTTAPAERGGPEPRRVFLSHTAELRDLPESRSFVAAVASAVSRAGDELVDGTADPRPTARLDRDAVAGADVHLLLAGFRYGVTVPERPELSYPEHEFEVAGELGIPRLVFLLGDRVQGSAALFVDPRHGGRQVGFRLRLRDSGVVTSDVDSPDHAETVVYEALTALRRARCALAPPGRAWSLPARPAGFAGRTQQLAALRAALTGPRPAVVQTLHGGGGAGKTSIAVEYAYRHAEDYDIAWWIPAERVDLVPDRLAALARALRLAEPTDHLSAAVARLLAELRGQDRWLLVFDDVVDPDAVAPFLPGGTGHVLIASTEPNRGSAAALGVGHLTRRESVALLRSRLPDVADRDADQMASALDDMPLAVDQAAALLAATDWTASAYLGLLRENTQRMRSRHGPAAGQPVPMAAAWHVAFDQLAGTEQAAAQLVTLAAWLAPEPVPLTVFTDHPTVLPEPLATSAGDPLEWARVLEVLRQRAIARVGPDTLLLHRIAAALVRVHNPLTAPERGWAAQAVAVVRAAVPDRAPVWQAMLPHIVTVTDPARDTRAVADDVGSLSEGLATHLHTRGAPRAARPYFERCYRQYMASLGEDHPSTLAAANNLAIVLREVGELDQADKLDQDILNRLGHILGHDDEEHPRTRTVAIDLSTPTERRKNAARPRPAKPPRTEKPARAEKPARTEKPVRQHKAQHQEKAQNPEKPARTATRQAAATPTVPVAARPAPRRGTIDQRVSAEHEQARKQCQDILERRRRILGQNHPDTLDCADRLAKILHSLGEDDQARELERWVAQSRAARS